ncbi:MAG: efflux RND transporter permease subunit [Acidobacteria bacterium]|nr:efflux RND transporter permease subunit [Acidobacteriota bacterium]
MSSHHKGIAGRLADSFATSKLTPLLVAISILLGIASLNLTPREEEPQIVVPMVDIMLPWPGHDASEVERLLLAPVEDVLMDIATLDYVYGISQQDGALLIARFDVGSDVEDALVQVNQALNEVDLPLGAMPPTTSSLSIDDVPVFAMTIWSSESLNEPLLELTDIAEEMAHDLRQEANVSEVEIIGAQHREWLVELRPADMWRHNVSAASVANQVQSMVRNMPLGEVVERQTRNHFQISTPISNPDDLALVPITNIDGDVLYLSDVATINQKAQPLRHIVWHRDHNQAQPTEAVTISVSKTAGANASHLTERLEARIENLRQHGVLPESIQTTITRDYGHTAKEKSDELIKHLLIATFSVIALVAFALGWREAFVVAIAVPVTLALTVLLSYLMGFTINRVTLFALIFSIGILVDDAIVVVENIHRHAVMRDARSWRQKIVDAVDEVGNPTILATFTVIAAILPLAYVGGLMGPYMLPIPILASSAMVFSLLIAFMISPWAAIFTMKPNDVDHQVHEGRLTRLYRRGMTRLLTSRRAYWTFFALTAVLMLMAFSLVSMGWVEVKMLPFDNKSELQIVVDMPEGTTLEETARVSLATADTVLQHPDVAHVQIYAGTASPFTFNGLVRHYFMRHNQHEADLAITLTDRHDRKRDSHEIAKQLRALVQSMEPVGQANIKVVEIPPGPPVLSTIVAELYGPDLEQQRKLAHAIANAMSEVPGIVDIDTYETAPVQRMELVPQPALMATYQIGSGTLLHELHTLSNPSLTLIPGQRSRQGMPLRIGMQREDAEEIASWLNLPLQTPSGMIPLSAVTQVVQQKQTPTIYHKNGQRVVYVIAEVAGDIEAPVYALAKLQDSIQATAQALGIANLPILHTNMPDNPETYHLKWDGEWHITVEVFRDMGIAFGAVLVLIYLLVVGWFKSFITPLVILSPIPLSLIGILPGHLIFGAFFTATSMIGFIAGAGIIVRNSIILVDFIELKRSEGISLRNAVIEAGVIRFRPMLLTAAAVVIGSAVILFDPIFQGLAISLMMGEVAATLLSRIAVPLLYAGFTKS